MVQYWGAFTLFLYIVMRMSGFVLMNPFFGRSGIPGIFKGGLIMLLSAIAYGQQVNPAQTEVPSTLIVFVVKLLLELGVGLTVGMIMRFFFVIPEQAGEMVDTQMGLSMAKTYDPGSQSSSTVTATLLNIMMTLIFFAENGHLTLIEIVVTSGELAPYGAVTMGVDIANRCAELFALCMVLAVKLNLPILAAELLGQVGMGVLMKVIPQINVFAINIELKVIVGLVMLLMLLSPISEDMMEIEQRMLREIELALDIL